MKRFLIVGTSLLLLAPVSPALAGSTTLICSGDPSMTIDLDEAGGTATVNYPPEQVDGTQESGLSSGLLTAKFTPRNVTFTWINNGGYDRFSIDRVTGIALDYSSINAPWEQASSSDRRLRQWQCQVGKKMF